MNNDRFWSQDLKILWINKKLLEFFPRTDMSLSEKLNSLVRLSVYISLIMSLYSNSSIYLFISIITILATYIIWENRDKNKIRLEIKDYEKFIKPKKMVNYVYPTKDYLLYD